MSGWSTEEMAARLARDVPPGSYVNLGIGLPTRVGAHIPAEAEVMRHSENGIVGMGPPPSAGHEDPDLIDAGKNPCTLVPGAAICDHSISFAIIRGGHLDISIIGGMQVSERGDLANWKVSGQPLGSVGGAMDLAIGAREVWAIMQHRDRGGAPKLVTECTYPLTGARCVTRVYTDLAVIAVGPDGLRVVELAPGVTPEALQAATAARLRFD